MALHPSLRKRFFHKASGKMYKVVGYLYNTIYCDRRELSEDRDTDVQLPPEDVLQFHIDEGVLLDYIGRTDASGKDLYEGDILKLQEDDADKLAEVVKVEGTYGLRDEENFWKDIPIQGKAKIEVIGNTYKDPGLTP